MPHETKSLYWQRVLSSVAVQGVGLGGFAIFIEGIRQIYQPAAMIVGGGLMIAWTILKVRRS